MICSKDNDDEELDKSENLSSCATNTDRTPTTDHKPLQVTIKYREVYETIIYVQYLHIKYEILASNTHTHTHTFIYLFN